MKTSEKYIARCISLAKNAIGNTYPNPMVGAVIVYEDKIIGEGWHQKAGMPHAEVNAINSVKNKDLLPKSTIYVSLEPCSHFGKTPPCSDLLIKHGFKKVVIGSQDPNHLVAGKGIQKLRNAGCEVQVGVLENECLALNKRFFTFHNKKRPYIILKWAQTKNLKIAPLSKKEQKPVWISNPYARQLVHQWRSQEQAILVGINTVIDDNPKLDTRDWAGQNPLRILIDKDLRIPVTANLLNNCATTWIFNQHKEIQIDKTFFKLIDFEQNVLEQILSHLYHHNIQSIIIEGGQKTIQNFIDANLWDEARVFTSETHLEPGIQAPTLFAKTIFSQKIQDNTLDILLPI